MQKLDLSFFNRPTLNVACDLIGKQITFFGQSGLITETEAYIGQDDPACHAARGMTSRNEVMFGKAGISYVYFIYGMYYCLNFVTEQEGFPAAVLIRGIKINEINELPYKKTNGPGKLCKILGINKEHNKIDITSSNDFFLSDIGYNPDITTTTRIGISQGKEKEWRFLTKETPL